MDERFWIKKAIQAILSQNKSDVEKAEEIATMISTYVENSTREQQENAQKYGEVLKIRNTVGQEFAYDSKNEIIYYISHQERKYVPIDKKQKELYIFLNHVYVCQWRIIREEIEKDYIQVDRIQKIYE